LAEDEVSEESERRDLDITGHCPECKEYTVKRRRSGVWTCANCSVVLSVEPWAQDAPQQPRGAPPAPRCIRSGCQEPSANGMVCAGHLHGERFAPSAEWQDLPDGYPCPPGVEWRTDLTTGTSQVRWPEMAAVAGGEE
jgi:hypothetical protein